MMFAFAWLSRVSGLTPFALQLIAGLAAIVLFAFALIGVERHGEHVQKARDDAASGAAIAAAVERDEKARDAAATQRAADAVSTAQLQTDLRNSYATQPDGAPSGVRLALYCRRLRDTPSARSAEFSKLCGPQGGNQAAPAH